MFLCNTWTKRLYLYKYFLYFIMLYYMLHLF